MTRHWCALVQYPGLEPVLFGTVMVRTGAPMHEVEAALTAAIRECLPNGWILRDMVPGGLFFTNESER